MEELSAKRFVRALRAAEEDLTKSAKCFCYTHEPEYQEILTDIQYCIRMAEHGEEFAGHLLYKLARNLSKKSLQSMAENAKSEDEQRFFVCLIELQAQRGQSNKLTE